MFHPNSDMTFKVMNRTEARKASFGIVPEQTVIISISDMYENANKFARNPNIRGICKVFFDDVDAGTPNAITESDAHQICKFMQNHPNAKNIIVHCGAGISRSAGVAAALMKVFTGSDAAIFDNPKYCPNMTVYRTVMNAFIQ